MDQKVADSQDHICPVCSDSLYNGEELHKHHIITVKKGGKNTVSNLIALHRDCHRIVHKSDESYNQYTALFLEIKNSKKKSAKNKPDLTATDNPK